ncbi:diaminopimelate epimerase [Massilia sp. W12]|uniref:diaminopimelate epimerase n=1 Tax=Massilia sp. W12 TaxID=3126507 RepID=UPI0030CE4191
MKLRFSKMHGAGNDFVVLDATRSEVPLDAAWMRRLADRRFGVGADQILVVQAADRPEIDFRYRIFNADGGEVEQCGNGARAFVKFVHGKGLTDKTSIRVQTMKGVIEPRLLPDGMIEVDMGPPRLAPQDIPFDSADLSPRQEAQAQLWRLPEYGCELGLVSMGNPHAVLLTPDVEAAPVTQLGPQIEHHARFPQRVNLGFMQILSRQQIALRVWERGAGETLACGTGACAAVVSGILRGLLDPQVRVQARGGLLQVRWQGPGQPVFLGGPAEFVFEGEIDFAL